MTSDNDMKAEGGRQIEDQSPVTGHRSLKSGRRPGKVWLIGAGPGDPELLTLKAVRALHKSDAVLVDELVDRRVPAHARPDARIVEVGKCGGEELAALRAGQAHRAA